MIVTGNLTLDGSLDVSLLSGFANGFTLDLNQQFLIVDVGGMLNGQFTDLGEGDLVDNFNGVDLLITYGDSSGNYVALFTSVPEPGTFGVMGLLMIGFMGGRRRKQELAA